MIDEMSKAGGSAAWQQRLAECFEGPDFVRIQDMKRYLLLPCLLRRYLDLAAADSESQQANAGISNKRTS